jgi:hypothetical protein
MNAQTADPTLQELVVASTKDEVENFGKRRGRYHKIWRSQSAF